MPKITLKSEISTTLGKRTNFSGDLLFKKSLKIDGHFSGKIVSDGYLYIEQGARVEADIDVGSLVLGGTIIGNVHAHESVELLASSCLKGNITSPDIKIADGVQLEVNCEMLDNPGDVDIFSASVDQLKKTVQRVVKKRA